jgi:virulence-associated protein VagC
MPNTGIAKLFRNGGSQAVRLPREFRFEGSQVRVRRVAEGVLLEPLIADPAQGLRNWTGLVWDASSARAKSLTSR